MDENWIKIGTLVVSGIAAIVGVVAFIVNLVKSRRLAQHEVYQRLELASIELFRFEMAHSDKTWRLYNENYTIADEQAEREITNHVTQLLNLFEMSLELHRNKFFSHEIFCTWLKWIFETAEYSTFRHLWEKDLRNHYTGCLGGLIEYSIETIKNDEIAQEDKFDTFTKSLCEKGLLCKKKWIICKLPGGKRFCSLRKYLQECNKISKP